MGATARSFYSPERSHDTLKYTGCDNANEDYVQVLASSNHQWLLLPYTLVVSPPRTLSPLNLLINQGFFLNPSRPIGPSVPLKGIKPYEYFSTLQYLVLIGPESCKTSCSKNVLLIEPKKKKPAESQGVFFLPRVRSHKLSWCAPYSNVRFKIFMIHSQSFGSS